MSCVVRKVTELQSSFYRNSDEDNDYLVDVLCDRAEETFCFGELCPAESLPGNPKPGAVGPFGKWRITVEFEPEENK